MYKKIIKEILIKNEKTKTLHYNISNKLESFIYSISWRINQIIHKVINKPAKNYKRTLTLKEILKGQKNEKDSRIKK